MQTILGSGGAIGVELAKALTKYTDQIKLVSRNPQKVNDTDILLSANLLNKSDVNLAIKDSDIVYVTVGFEYNLKVWQNSWPAFMKDVINACIENNTKLVFFDNIYMYDKDFLANMTEETKINPPSKKGIVRTEVLNMIMDKVNSKELTALIARSADFYGPSIKKNCALTEIVFDPFSKNKKATWLASAKFKHSFTYTPDAGKATALLGNTDTAYNQIWHLPTAENPLTGKELIELIAKEMDIKPKFQVASKFLMKIIGIFVPMMRELPEMMYQYDRDYIFNSNKFTEHFDFKPTSYIDGVKEIVKTDYRK